MARALATALVAGAAGLAALGGLSACGDTGIINGDKSPEPIHIGAIFDLSGAQSSLDIPSLDGARLAVDRLNAAGGLLGRRVELLERDGQTDTSVVRYDAHNLARLHVSAMIGLSDTDQVLAAAPIAAAAGIPFVTSGATSPLLPDQVPDWLFLACFGDNEQAAAGAEYAVTEMGTRRVAVLYDKDLEYTRLLQHYFTEAFKAYGGTVVFSRAFDTGKLDVAKLMEPAIARRRRLRRRPRVHLIYVAVRAGRRRTAGAAAAGRRVRAAHHGRRQLRQPASRQCRRGVRRRRVLHDPRRARPAAQHPRHAQVLDQLHGGLRTLTRERLRRPRLRRRQPRRQGHPQGEVGRHRRRSATNSSRCAPSTASPDRMSYAGDTFVPAKAVTVVSVGSEPELAMQLTPIFVPDP